MAATVRCLFPAWIAGWATAVFLPSLLIAFLGLSEQVATSGTGFERLPATTWQVADAVGPAVKLLLGGLLLAAFAGIEKGSGQKPASRYGAAVILGALAALATMILIPLPLSRGFAAGLAGSRFDPALAALYLVGGSAAGLVFVASADRCRQKFQR